MALVEMEKSLFKRTALATVRPMLRALLIVLAVWAAIYLPALGSLEIKGEEGRRILPGITMLETGNYLVPQIGSEPYYRKPPLVNWLVAASFKLTGSRNEWTARLPSALCVLAVALAFITAARASLGANGSLIGAIVWMINLGMIEKGRLIEIEAIYVSLFGLALIFWLSGWMQRRSAWFTWLVPAIFLGLGLLAKGPLHLLFFYAMVGVLLYRTGELRKLYHPAHLLGILLMLGVFAAWAIPYWQAVRGENLAQTWSSQFTGRLSASDFKVSSWLLNVPRGLAYFLPWTFLLPLIPGAKFETQRENDVSRALAWSCAIPFLLVNLLPSALPRYAMPLLVPAAWLMAMTLAANEIRPPCWWPAPQFHESPRRRRFVFLTTIVTAGLVSLYALGVVPILQRRSKVKPLATQIDAAVPSSETLYAIDPDFQPLFFYIRSRVVYLSQLADVPLNARYLLVQTDRQREVMESERWLPLRALPVLTVTDYRKRSVILAKVTQL